MSTLDYRSAPTAERANPLAAGVFSVSSAVAASIVFFLTTVVLQDYLVNGDGHSWRRAATIAAIPAVILILFGLGCARIAWRGPRRTRIVATFGILSNLLAIAFVVDGIFSA